MAEVVAGGGEMGDAPGVSRVPRAALAAFLTCPLCKGYFREASAFAECGHTCEFSLPLSTPLPRRLYGFVSLSSALPLSTPSYLRCTRWRPAPLRTDAPIPAPLRAAVLGFCVGCSVFSASVPVPSVSLSVAAWRSGWRLTRLTDPR